MIKLTTTLFALLILSTAQAEVRVVATITGSITEKSCLVSIGNYESLCSQTSKLITSKGNIIKLKRGDIYTTVETYNAKNELIDSRWREMSPNSFDEVKYNNFTTCPMNLVTDGHFYFLEFVKECQH